MEHLFIDDPEYLETEWYADQDPSILEEHDLYNTYHMFGDEFCCGDGYYEIEMEKRTS